MSWSNAGSKRIPRPAALRGGIRSPSTSTPETRATTRQGAGQDRDLLPDLDRRGQGPAADGETTLIDNVEARVDVQRPAVRCAVLNDDKVRVSAPAEQCPGLLLGACGTKDSPCRNRQREP